MKRLHTHQQKVLTPYIAESLSLKLFIIFCKYNTMKIDRTPNSGNLVILLISIYPVIFRNRCAPTYNCTKKLGAKQALLMLMKPPWSLCFDKCPLHIFEWNYTARFMQQIYKLHGRWSHEKLIGSGSQYVMHQLVTLIDSLFVIIAFLFRNSWWWNEMNVINSVIKDVHRTYRKHLLWLNLIMIINPNA